MSLTKKILTGLTGEKNPPAEEKSLPPYFTPSSNIDWANVQHHLVHGPGAGDSRLSVHDSHRNSAVLSCLMTVAVAATEPPLSLRRRARDGSDEDVPEHPVLSFLDRPMPPGALDRDELIFWTVWALGTDGNAYWKKVRSGNETTGNVVQVWPVSPAKMEPVTERDSENFIDFYRRTIRPGEYENIPVENVIHFRMGVDPHDPRLGVSKLKSLLREVSTDDEAAKFTAALLHNYAVPGLVVVPRGSDTITKEQAEDMAEVLGRKFGNDQRGNIAVVGRDAEVKPFGFSPKDLDLSLLHRIPEERISAAIGVPAIVAGLGAGLDRATYANFREAREMFTESTMAPLWRMMAHKMSGSLLIDFASDRRLYLSFDLTGVRALQEDETEKYARLSAGVQKPWIMRNEARSDVGLPPVPGWDEEDQAPPVDPFAGVDEEDADEEDAGSKLLDVAALGALTRSAIDERITDEDLKAAQAAWKRYVAKKWGNLLLAERWDGDGLGGR